MKTTTTFKKVFNQDSGAHRRDGLNYKLTDAEIRQFNDRGYLVLNDFLTEAEVATLDDRFDYFIAGKQEGMGRDFCDMSQPYGTPIEQFRLVNAALPSHYCDELKNNIFHQIAANVANQLYANGNAIMDYDQFLAKKPGKEQARFHMHQDLGYWPKTKNTWTATFSLALTDSDIENGCLMVIDSKQTEETVREEREMGFTHSHNDKVKWDTFIQ